MYTLKMNEDKELVTTQVRKLLQGENLVDKLRFLIPQKYGEIDITPYDVNLICVNQGNVGWSEKLHLASEKYNDEILCYYLPVDSKLTKYAGSIRLKLAFSNDYGNILYTEEATILVEPTKLYIQHLIKDPMDDSDDDSWSDDSSGGDGYKVVEF
jgi:hypothetical protein